MSELGKKYEKRVTVENLDATNKENAPKQRELGFMSHGLVIRDKEHKIVFKQADHTVKEAEVAAFVAKYFKSS